MKSSFRHLPAVLLGLAFLPLNSCVTDEYGHSAVSPGGAVALALGAVFVGAAIADNGDHHDCHGHWHGYRHHHNCR